MARILNLEAYPLATTISDDSYLVGTDVTDNKETKNFKIEDLKTHILPAPLSPSGTFENATVVVDSVGQISSVTQGASGSSKWSFSPNADDIYRNSNVGIGDFSAADPAQELEVQGKVQVSGADAEFIGDINGAIRFSAKAGEALSKGDVVYISEISGNIPVVSKADASDSAKMPAFGLAFAAASLNSSVEVITFGTLSSIDTSAFSLGDTVYVSTTAGELTNTPPTGEANLLQNIGKVQRVQASSGSIKVGGAGRTNATPNLNEGSLFIGNSSNQSSTLAIGGASTFLKSDGTTAAWSSISSSDLPANLALVGTYTDGYVPRWNATTNTLESGTIQDNGTSIGIGITPENRDRLKIKDSSGVPRNEGENIGVNVGMKSTSGTDKTFGASFVVDSTTTGEVRGVSIEAKGSASSGSINSINGMIITSQLVSGNATDVVGINVDANNTGGTASGDAIGIKIQGASGSFLGTKYGIYQSGSNDKNYLAGQLQLGHTAGTAGQFLKSADTSGNSEWSTISASDVTGAVTATTGAAQRVAVFDGTDSIEGDSNLTWNSAALTVTDGTDSTDIRDRYIVSKSESDDANLYLYGYGDTGSNSGEIYLAGSRGTIASPTATQSGDTLGEIGIFGAVPGLRQGARILFQATENYVDTSNYGTRFVLQTVADGSTTLVTRYATDGDGNHSFNGNVKVDGQAYSDIQSASTPTTAQTIDWDDGNVAIIDLGSATGNVTLTLSNPKAGASYFIKIIQGASLVDVIFPTSVKLAGETAPYTLDVTATDNAIDAVALTCISDSGTVEYLANVSQNYG